MPTAERLAEDGLRYSRFHTTALCSPTRSALLTGRNHHSVGMGTVTNLAVDEPGYDAMRSPRRRRSPGRSTSTGTRPAPSARCTRRPTPRCDPSGPFTHWPTNEGFEKFYGFLGGETDQFVPNLVDGTTYIDPPGDRGGRLPLLRGPGRPGDGVDPRRPHVRRRPALVLLSARSARPTRRSTCRETGATATAASSPTDGTAAGDHPGPAAGAGHRAGGRRARAMGRGRTALGRALRRRAAGRRTTDGDVRRVRRAHRRPGRPAHRRAARVGRARQHHRLLHPRRQRGVLPRAASRARSTRCSG